MNRYIAQYWRKLRAGEWVKDDRQTEDLVRRCSLVCIFSSVHRCHFVHDDIIITYSGSWKGIFHRWSPLV